MARARLGKHDVPEVMLGSGEADAHKAVFLLFADASDEAFYGFIGHLIENTDHLAGQERGVHDNQSAVGADVLGVSLEVNGFSFRHVATNLQRDLKGDPDGATPFWVAGTMHKPAVERGQRVQSQGSVRSLPRLTGNNKRLAREVRGVSELRWAGAGRGAAPKGYS